MSSLVTGNSEVNSIFQLIGNKENDITKSIAWAFCKCPEFMKLVVDELLGISIEPNNVIITYQKYESEKGITDLELTDGEKFYLIIEAKRGWNLPEERQLTMYSERGDLINSPAKLKAIVSMSECNMNYALCNLPFQIINDIPIKHLPWRRIYELAIESRMNSNNEQKHLLEELTEYLGGIMTTQTKDSNWVYVVALGTAKPDGCNLTWIEIVQNHLKYFHPVGGKGWPKDPPNYIAFRYYGKLQSIHHINDYVVTKNMHDEIPEMPDEIWEDNCFVYKLGPAIIPSKEVRTGKIYRNGRVWAMFDTLFSSDTIADARNTSKDR